MDMKILQVEEVVVSGYKNVSGGIGASSYGKYTKARGDYSMAVGCGTEIDTTGGSFVENII